MPQPLTPENDACDVADREMSLSDRQREVLALVARGATDSEIAQQLCLSVDTVAWHVKEIRTRLDARSRAHAVALAMRHSLLPSEQSSEKGS
jgi:DNA-binding CsgD family transcriptional regulator